MSVGHETEVGGGSSHGCSNGAPKTRLRAGFVVSGGAQSGTNDDAWNNPVDSHGGPGEGRQALESGTIDGSTKRAVDRRRGKAFPW